MESSDNRAPTDREPEAVLRMPRAIPGIIPKRWVYVLLSQLRFFIRGACVRMYKCVPHCPAQQMWYSHPLVSAHTDRTCSHQYRHNPCQAIRSLLEVPAKQQR